MTAISTNSPHKFERRMTDIAVGLFVPSKLKLDLTIPLLQATAMRKLM